MNHLRAIFVKFVSITAVLVIVLGFIYGVNFGDVLVISLILTIGAYVLGDLFILPRYGNLAATLADFGLAFFGVWMLGNVFIEEYIRIGVASFLSAILISVCEIFFHSYMVRNIINQTDYENRPIPTRTLYQTEMGEESHPKFDKQKKKDRL